MSELAFGQVSTIEARIATIAGMLRIASEKDPILGPSNISLDQKACRNMPFAKAASKYRKCRPQGFW